MQSKDVQNIWILNLFIQYWKIALTDIIKIKFSSENSNKIKNYGSRVMNEPEEK